MSGGQWWVGDEWLGSGGWVGVGDLLPSNGNPAYCFFTISSSPLPSPLSEADITKERVQKILGAGANVVLTTGGIDDLCLKYFVEAGAMAARRCKKEDLKRIAKATGEGSCDCHVTV